MRDYAKISPQFWIGDTGRRIREGGKDCQIMAVYLLSCPSSNMIGLYYLPLATMSHETGLAKAACLKALQRLAELGFGQWDQDTETVFVTEMAAYQIGEPLKASDNRCKGVEREWSAFKSSPYYRQFHARYRGSFHLPKPPPPRNSEGASKTLRSQEQEQEHLRTIQTVAEQGNSRGSEPGAAAKVIPLAGRAGR